MLSRQCIGFQPADDCQAWAAGRWLGQQKHETQTWSRLDLVNIFLTSTSEIFPVLSLDSNEGRKERKKEQYFLKEKFINMKQICWIDPIL